MICALCDGDYETFGEVSRNRRNGGLMMEGERGCDERVNAKGQVREKTEAETPSRHWWLDRVSLKLKVS